MCYRYSVPGPKELEKEFDAEFARKESFARTYHVSSFDLPRLPVITNEDPKQIQLFVWGLIPFWVKDEHGAEKIRVQTMNVRSETLYEKPAFRQSAVDKHCLVLADGFFEWQEVQGRKYPYYIRLKSHKPFAMAGVWDHWVNTATKEDLFSYSVITTKANPLMERIHNTKKRMPVILGKEERQYWLARSLSKDEAVSLLAPYDQNEMEAFTISRLLTTRGKHPNVPAVLHPFVYPELQQASRQAPLF